MRFGSKLFFCSIFLFSASVMADVKLTVDSGIELIAVNGTEFNGSFFGTGKNTVELLNGDNQVLVRYSVEMKSSGDTEIESSNPHVLLFEAHDDLVLLSAPEIKKMDDLRDFDNGKYWILTGSSGESIDYQAQPRIREGFELSRDYEQELKEFNRKGGAVSMKSDSSISDDNISAVTSVLSENNNLPEVMLRYWYFQADHKTKVRFKSWVLDK